MSSVCPSLTLTASPIGFSVNYPTNNWTDDGACPRAESDGNEPDSLIYHKATNKRKCFFFFT